MSTAQAALQLVATAVAAGVVVAGCQHPAPRGAPTSGCLDYTGDRTDIGALGRACQGIDDERYPLVCDDSGDCPAGHTCCDELGGDPDYHICTPLLCRLVETVPPAVPPRALPNG
jgi:hypothetical protein